MFCNIHRNKEIEPDQTVIRTGSLSVSIPRQYRG